MKLQSLDWTLQPAMEALYLRYGPQTAALHFSSLYLWRHEMQLSVLLEPDLFAVHAGWRGQDAWFFPCGPDHAVQRFLEELSRRPTAQLCYVSGPSAAFASRILPGTFEFRRAPADDEYLYDIARQLALQGKEFRHHRNALHRVQNTPGITCRPLCPQTLGDAGCILDAWIARRHRAAPGGLIGADAARQFLQSTQQLRAVGVLVYQDGIPVCLAAGYPLTAECFDLSICIQSRGDTSLAVYARYRLCQLLEGSFRLFNAEEDLGLPGLSLLKRGMGPCRITEMYEGKLYGAFTPGV